MARERQNSFFGGAAILAAGIALVKVIGALFKIPIVRILGEASYADFSNAYYIYSILLTVSTAGLSVALSKMVATSHAVERDGQVRKIFRVSLTVFFALGFGSFLLMFFGNNFLAARMHDSQAAAAIRYLAPAVMCVSLLSSFRGYFQGHSYMVPSATSQVIEALGKLLIGLPLAYWAVRAAKGEDLCAAYAILGVTMGEVLALLYMAVEYARNRPKGRPLTPATSSAGSIFKELMVIAIPITLTSSAVSIINLIDASVVQGQLQNALGMAEGQSRRLFGAYSGVQNIYNLPASFIIAVTASVIPNVSAAIARERHREAGRVVKAAFHVTALLVFPMGVGMSVLAEPIVRLIFDPSDPALSGRLLAILGIASICVCMVQVCNSVLQAYGYQHLPIGVMVAAGGAMLVIDYNLVAIPSVNIYGSPIGTLCCFAIAAGVDFYLIHRLVPHPPRLFRLFFGPALASAVMGLAAWGSYRLLDLVAGNTASVFFAILVAVAVYGFLVVYLKLLSRNELQLMPKGDKIADLLRLP